MIVRSYVGGGEGRRQLQQGIKASLQSKNVLVYFKVKSINASYRWIEVKTYFVTVCLFFFCFIWFSSCKEPSYVMNQAMKSKAQLSPG